MSACTLTSERFATTCVQLDVAIIALRKEPYRTPLGQLRATLRIDVA
jgi:hypothetical protein